MAYRNPLAWDRNRRPGLFKHDPNAVMPAPRKYAEEQPSQLEIDLSLARDFEEIDRRSEELGALFTQPV